VDSFRVLLFARRSTVKFVGRCPDFQLLLVALVHFRITMYLLRRLISQFRMRRHGWSSAWNDHRGAQWLRIYEYLLEHAQYMIDVLTFKSCLFVVAIALRRIPGTTHFLRRLTRPASF